MQKTIVASYSSTGAFYFSIACLGYAALGATVPGDVLVGFDVSKEVELMANSAVLFHMIAAVQVSRIADRCRCARYPLLLNGGTGRQGGSDAGRNLMTCPFAAPSCPPCC